MFRTLYLTTRDQRGHRHEYRQPVNEEVPSGHEIVNARTAGEFRLADMLSPDDLSALFILQKHVGGVKVRSPKKGRALKLNSLSMNLKTGTVTEHTWRAEPSNAELAAAWDAEQ